MSSTPQYQFKFAIVDEATGDVIGTDFCALTDIDQFGDMHVAHTLRWFKRTGRAEHEAANYPAKAEA